jgi:PAS domain-containing protein
MAAAKPIQMILARQLASCVAMPILLIDADGTLVYYNESAEQLLNQRFDETGEISADDFVALVEVTDDDRNTLSPDERPTRVARIERRPVSRTIWTRARDTEWRHLQVTAVPLIDERRRVLGVMHIFWEI